MQEACQRFSSRDADAAGIAQPKSDLFTVVRNVALDSVTMTLDVVYLEATTGALLHGASAKFVVSAQRFISGLHVIGDRLVRSLARRRLWPGAGREARSKARPAKP